MRYALAFLVLGLVVAVDALRRWRDIDGILSVGIWSIEIVSAITFLMIATIYGLSVSGRPMEGAFGGVHLVGLALRPYQAFAAVTLWACARLGRESLMDEVATGLYLGRMPFPKELSRLDRASIARIVQLCAEFPNLSGLRTVQGMEVVVVPILDGLPPTDDQFSRVIEAVRRWRTEGSAVLIHCAQGHGRAATITAAVLVACGLAEGAEAALELVRRARPRARPSRNQRIALGRYLERRRTSGFGRDERIC